MQEYTTYLNDLAYPYLPGSQHSCSQSDEWVILFQQMHLFSLGFHIHYWKNSNLLRIIMSLLCSELVEQLGLTSEFWSRILKSTDSYVAGNSSIIRDDVMNII
jgi:hypothetical protein